MIEAFEVVTKTYSKTEHLPILENWVRDWELDAEVLLMNPPTGRIMYVNDKPICAGFLTKTDTGVAMISGLICDKKSDKHIRSMCLDGLINKLEILAQVMGFRMMCVSTLVPEVVTRFEKFGYNVLPEKYINLGRSF